VPLGELSPEQYASLLALASERCDTVLLVVRPGDREPRQMRRVLRALAPALREAVLSPVWPGTGEVPPQPDDDLPPARVYLYDYTPEVQRILASAGSLDAWLQPERPEDLPLLQGRTPWLTSTTHEHYAFLHLTATERRALEWKLPLGQPDPRLT
jgi:hypothetical protein